MAKKKKKHPHSLPITSYSSSPDKDRTYNYYEIWYFQNQATAKAAQKKGNIEKLYHSKKSFVYISITCIQIFGNKLLSACLDKTKCWEVTKLVASNS